eukprot:jgi/Botrbrau1/2761/Bobra.0164s0039.2
MGKDRTKSASHSLQGDVVQLFCSISRKSGLQVEYIAGQDMITVEGVFTDDEAKRWVATAVTSGRFQHQGSCGAAKGEAFRDNDRFAVASAHLAKHLWEATGLSHIMKDICIGSRHAVGLNPNLRFYRVGQKFGKHIDDSVDVPGMGTTCYTLLIYLSGQCGSAAGMQGFAGAHEGLVGGETVFYGVKGKKTVKVVPKPGLALLHLHGDDCLEHEAAAVKKGIKYVLRSDVVYA